MDNVQRVTEQWNRIKTWFESNAPAMLDRFAEGTDGESLAQAEQNLGFEIPESLKQSFLECNGSDESYVFGRWYPVDVEMMLDERDCNLSVAKEVAASTGAEPDSIWHPRWLPFCSDGGGNFLVVDADSSRVLQWDHEEGEGVGVAQDLASWLETLAADLEGGKYRLNDDGDGFEEE